jgi:glycosyltransferase involved in cell wall biosynthesis
LLFRGLSALENVHVEGLLQSGGALLPPGIAAAGARGSGRMPPDEGLDRLGRIVIMLDEPLTRRGQLRTALHTIRMALWRAMGGSETLTHFPPGHFREYLWNRLFAKSLDPADFDLVTGAGYRVARIPCGAMQICARFTARYGAPVYARLNTQDFDLMLAETPYPATVSRNTQLVVRYHDAIPMLMPHTIEDRSYHRWAHYQALRLNVANGAWFACVSDATRKDLLSIFPEAEPRAVTIHNMISNDYFDAESRADRVPEIIATHQNGYSAPPRESLDYLLMVSTLEPRKNHLTLLSAWEALRVQGFRATKIVMVGEAGWHNEPILRKFKPWVEQGEVLMISDVSSVDLRLLYKHARATICPSYGEGFDYPGVEAMRSGGVVIASDIPVHREVYAHAAEYFNPYSTDDLARAIQSVIDPANAARRQELVRQGAALAQRYTCEAIMPQWEAFLRDRAAAS